MFGVGLHALQHVETAAAALTLRAVGGVGDNLQLAQHELRHHHGAINEAGLGDVGDAAVDDDAGVKHLGAAAGGLFAGEDGPQRRGIEQVALVGAHQQPHVGHQQQHEDLQHGRGVAIERGRAQHQAEQRRAKDAQHLPDDRADEPAEAERPDAQFEDDDRAGSTCARARTHPSCQAEGMKEITDPAEQGHKKKTNQNQIHRRPTPAGHDKPGQAGHSW